MENQDQDIVAGLDIGTTKIACIVGRKNEQGKIEILGMGKSRSDGVTRGVVANIQKTVESIKLAVKEAEDSAGVDIGTVNVGIAGQHIRIKRRRILEDHGDERARVSFKARPKLRRKVDRPETESHFWIKFNQINSRLVISVLA